MTTVLDRVIFLLLGVFAVVGIFLVREIFPSGYYVEVSVDNKPVYSLSLQENRIVKVHGPLGDTVVEIKNNKVRIKDSPCPEKICVRNGWTDRGAIVCLPNRVVVSVSNKREQDYSDIDAITR
jgi:hypothetical protein